jgi:hypothetical protein
MIILNRLKALLKITFGKLGSPAMMSRELQEKFGLYAENRPIIKLNRNKVPPEFHDLIPLAEKWGIGDDIMRSDFEKKASLKEKEELVERLKDRIEEIEKWALGKGPISDEMAAFMFMTSVYCVIAGFPKITKG